MDYYGQFSKKWEELEFSDNFIFCRGVRYQELKESYILFICKEDPFGLGNAVYTKDIRFREAPNFLYDDKSNVVFYNSSGYEAAGKTVF